MTVNIQELLAERGDRYGKFDTHADVTQAIKSVLRKSVSWGRMNASQREALEMIAHKIGRIVNGNPNYADSWDDIAGYAKLVSDEITAKDAAQ